MRQASWCPAGTHHPNHHTTTQIKPQTAPVKPCRPTLEFAKTKFEVFALGNKTITTYDGIHKAKIHAY